MLIRRKAIIITCLGLLLIGCSFSLRGQQQIKNYVQQNLVTIATISPDSNNYSDFDIIGKSIGNSRIVMLGEEDHGDASAFLAKTSL